MELANHVQETAESVTDSLSNLQGMLIELYLTDDKTAVRTTVSDLISQITRAADLALSVGFAGYYTVSLRLVERVLPLATSIAVTDQLVASLEEWVQLSFKYLDDPTAPQHQQDLIEFLSNAVCGERLSQDRIDSLQQAFTTNATNGAVAHEPTVKIARITIDTDSADATVIKPLAHKLPIVSTNSSNESLSNGSEHLSILPNLKGHIEELAIASAMPQRLLNDSAAVAAAANRYAHELAQLTEVAAAELSPHSIELLTAITEELLGVGETECRFPAEFWARLSELPTTLKKHFESPTATTRVSLEHYFESLLHHITSAMLASAFPESVIVDDSNSEKPDGYIRDFQASFNPSTLAPGEVAALLNLEFKRYDASPESALVGNIDHEPEYVPTLALEAIADVSDEATQQSDNSSNNLSVDNVQPDMLTDFSAPIIDDHNGAAQPSKLEDPDALPEAWQTIDEHAISLSLEEARLAILQAEALQYRNKEILVAEQVNLNQVDLDEVDEFGDIDFHEDAQFDDPQFDEDSHSDETYADSTQSDLEISAGVSELVTMIRDELAGCNDALNQALESAATAALAGDTPSFEDYRWQVERLSSAAEVLGAAGLHIFLSRVLEATAVIENSGADLLPQYCEILDRWPPLVANYLEHIGGVASCHELVNYVTSSEFPLPLESTASEVLFEQLRHPDLGSNDAAQPKRVTEATPAHVSLQVPDDIDPDVLASLLQELPTQTQDFSAALQRIAAGNGRLEDILFAQRIAHTIKGSANTVGIRGIAELAHHLEDIFRALEERETQPPIALARTLVEAADCLEGMSEALLGISPAPMQALAVLQSVLDWANKIDGGDFEADASTNLAASLPAQIAMPVAHVSSTLTAEVMAEPAARPFIAHQSEPAAAAPTLRVATTHIDDLLRLSGESKIIGGQLKEGLRRVESQLQAVRRQNQLFQQLVHELEQLVDVRGISMPLMRKNNSGFDALELDQYGELHTVSRRLSEAALDSTEWGSAAQSELRSLEDLLLSQARHSNEAQNSILEMRMVPATTIVGRLQRSVRQTCRLLDKDVELIVKGAETLVDSDTLSQLVDPLMHLMRNAIDHGIESADRRAANNKLPKGHLTIDFGRDGNQILVRVTDDGRGLDYAAIRATAAERGLIAADAVLTEAQLAHLILEPGFSTRSEVTQTSGRGIGLDVVHSRVLELKGSLEIQSELNRGCRFIIRLPATLFSAHALLVRHGRHTVAVASRGVKQILDGQAGKVIMLGDRLSLQVGNAVYEAHRLETLLGQPLDRRESERAQRPALLVEVSVGRICAILVQAVVDTIDLVVKPLGPFVPRSVGLVGATILGDGSVAPVMDLPDLLRHGVTSAQTTSTIKTARNIDSRSVKKQLPTVLVVDDSLTVRRSMEQLLRDSGYDVRLARDGLEAIAILDAKKPDLLLVDLEMPRMNGMELTVYVRSREATRNIPVIMITSRSTDKHRKQAAAAGVNHYITKPYAADELLEHMTAFLHSA